MDNAVPMARTTLNQKNLEALGAERLAALLMEVSNGNANAKRRLRMELAGVESPGKLVHEIRKRLTSIANATAFVGWRSLKTFKSDLDTQRRLIADQIADAAPDDALDLMWTFLALSDSVLERTTDTSGEVLEIFRLASEDTGRIAAKARIEMPDLVEKAAHIVLTNGYGQVDPLVVALAGVLGEDGLSQLRVRLLAMEKEPEQKAAPRTRRTSRWRRGRRLERETVKRRTRQQMVHQALLDIADALGDVDAYIRLQTDIRLPATAARVADRLLKADRAEDALGILDNVRTSLKEMRPIEWQDARLRALDQLGRHDEAQSFRLACFHQSLNRDFLRAYLKRLPDFDDIEAEDEALDFVAAYPDLYMALDFLIAWPALDRAARLVTARIGDIDGNEDDVLPYAAEKLSARYPLAATLLLRKMIDAILNNSRTTQYERAADYLSDCQHLAVRIDNQDGFVSHEDYVAKLKAAHSRKYDFWNVVAS